MLPLLAVVFERWFQRMLLARPAMWTTRFSRRHRLNALTVAQSCVLLSRRARSNTVHLMALSVSCGPLGRSLVAMIALLTLVFMVLREGWHLFPGSGQSIVCHA